MSSKSPGISSWGAISLILVIQHLPLYLASSVSAPSCDPLICSCSPDLSLGNCSSKGFLSMPTGLPSQIETLVLSHNDLTAINTTELGRLTDLRQLDLRHNQLSSLFAGVHYSLSNLDLSFNNISSVRALHVEGLVALTEINLANNKIISLPSNAFTGVVMLKSLNLRSNKIVSLEPGCLDKITGLEEFILAKNRLSSVPKGLFQKMKNLRLLELSKNKFVEIQGLSFHGLENLEILKLKRNQIEYLNDGAFFGLHQIQELHLDRNRVNRVDKGWLYGLYTLRTLNLAFNRVNHITDDAWEFCRDLTDLDLRSNLLQLLDRDSLRMLPRLKRLFLQDNLISHIQDEDTFAEVPLVEVLALDGNKISHTIEDMKSPFKGLLHLQRLTLSRNQIKSVGDQAFLGIDDLESIDLRDNVISTIQENAFQHLTKLESLEIDSESILCDCYLKWFPKWVNETRISGCQAKCAHPENLKGQVITSVPYESYTCDDFPKPYILKQPKTQITLKGDDLALSCRAASTSPAEMTFQWKLNSDLISDNLPECPRQPGDESDDVDSGGSISSSSSSSSGSASHSATTNFKALGRCITNFAHSFDGKGRELTSQLHLTNLTYDDAGKYQCVVANRFGATYSDKANITVYVYPQFLVTSEDITVEGGKTAALKCAAKGVPTPELSWSKDSGSDFPAATERRIKATTYSSGDDSRTNVHNFLIYQVKAEDMGVYQCTASNPAGKISWNVTLSVLEVPRFIRPMESKVTAEGETAVMECIASGSPKPRLTWTKDGGRLEATERHFFTADNQLLIIVKAKTEDAGRYECTVHNQLGTEIQFSNLAISTSNSTIGGILTDGREDNSLSQTIEVIIAAFVCILFLIILVLLYLCCRTRMRRRASGTRRNSSRADSDFEQGNLRFKRSSSSNPLRDGNLPPSMNTSGSPGEGEFDIHEHVRKVLLSPSREDLSDSIVSPTNRNPRTGLLTTDLKNSRKSPPPPPLPIRGDSSHPLKEEEVEERDSGTGASKKSSEDPEDEYQDRETLLRSISMQQGGGEGAISLSEFEIGNSYCGKESKGVIPFADQEEDSLEDGPNSIVSDSSTQQGGGEGQFGSMDGGETEDFDESTTASSSMFTDQEGRPANRSHHQPHDVVVSNHAMDDSNSSFKTFHPKGRRQRQISEVQALRSAKSSYNVFGGINNPNQGSDILDGGGTKNQLKTSTKRASAVELNGKCYLPIEPEPDPTEVPLEARVYRGGVGSLPRRGLDLQLELLEASLNSSDCLDDSRLSQRPMLKKNRNSFSRNSLLGGSKRQKQGKSHNRREPSLPRIKIKDPNKNNDLERSNVALKSKDMFT